MLEPARVTVQAGEACLIVEPPVWETRREAPPPFRTSPRTGLRGWSSRSKWTGKTITQNTSGFAAEPEDVRRAEPGDLAAPEEDA